MDAINVEMKDGGGFVNFVGESTLIQKNLVICSKIPNICQEEPCILGVDEAGRGPVLGPMVYGIAFCPVRKADEFVTLGCADSKALTEKKREDIFAVLCACEDYIGWTVDAISPNYISNSMLKRVKRSLNEVAEDSTVGLIQSAIRQGVLVSEIYVDTVGPPDKYREKLLKYFPDCRITVAKKADSTYPIVSAASICAKVARDRIITNWKFAESGVEIVSNNFGSGYPNDPATKTFLSGCIDEVFGFPSLVRFSWSTAEKLLEKDAYAVEWEDDDEENAPSVKNYFNSSLSTQHVMNHAFFKERKVNNAKFF